MLGCQPFRRRAMYAGLRRMRIMPSGQSVQPFLRRCEPQKALLAWVAHGRVTALSRARRLPKGYRFDCAEIKPDQESFRSVLRIQVSS